MNKSISNKEEKSVNKKIGDRSSKRLSEPRVKPIPFSDWDEELQKIWKKGIKHAVWQQSEHFNHLSFNDWGYNEVWENLLSVFDSCNVVDIGKNI